MGCGVLFAAACARLTWSIQAFKASPSRESRAVENQLMFQRAVRQHSQLDADPCVRRKRILT